MYYFVVFILTHWVLLTQKGFSGTHMFCIHIGHVLKNLSIYVLIMSNTFGFSLSFPLVSSYSQHYNVAHVISHVICSSYSCFQRDDNFPFYTPNYLPPEPPRDTFNSPNLVRCEWWRQWTLSYWSHLMETKPLLSVSTSILFTVCYSEACQRVLEIIQRERWTRSIMQRRYNAIQHSPDGILPWFIQQCKVFLLTHQRRIHGLCEKAIRLVNNGSLYWKLRAE